MLKKLRSLSVLLFLLPFAEAGADKKAPESATPVFSRFTYRGNDRVYGENPLKPDEFYNPVLQGCYPDPSICRKGNDYYLVCSSFAMFPGVPIFRSGDLVNWTPLGHVLDRMSQLKVHNAGISAGIYAPTIRYNPRNDTFYMITTEIADGFGNIVVKTKDPAKGWSDPYKLNFDGIDPSLFFDDDGKAYVVHNDAPAPGKELYSGHRVIKMWEYDVEKDRVIPGTDRIIVDGGVDISQKPVWIEAPHLYKKDGRYYLMCAEGGTGSRHSEVIFVGDDVKGPYIPAENNPVLTQRYFPRNRANKVDWAGHADLVETPDGKYYGVFLAVRPNEKNRVNTGRETFILPVDWSGKYPVFENGLIPLKPTLKMPEGVTSRTGKEGIFPNGNFTFEDNFTAEKPDYRWIGMRGPREDFISAVKGGGIKIKPFPVGIKEAKPVSALFYRQQHIAFEATVTMTYKPSSEKDLAGMVCYQSEAFHYVFGITKKDEDYLIVLERTERKGTGRDSQTVSAVIASEKINIDKPVLLKIKAQGDDYSFHYSTDGADFKNPGGTVSGDILSTDVAGGFTGCLIGLYATSANDVWEKPARNPLIFADAPDMSMIRVGDIYYMSSTTMHFNPGVPVMKSKDLSNWEIVNYAYDTLGDADDLNLESGKNYYGKGSWASCIRYHNGLFYLSTFAHNTGDTYIYTTKDMEKGPWKAHRFQPAYHDHSIFHEDDGRIFMIYGGNRLHIVELKSDLSGIIGGTDRVLIENASAPAGQNMGLGAEGSQLFKYSGRYYLFNICWPRDNVRTVVVHRADKVTGPYDEGRVVFQDRGIAQGGIVDTPDGRWYACLFRDYGAVGRIPYLVPMTWEDGWPVIGIDGKAPDLLDLPPSKGLIPGIVASDAFDRKKGDRPLPPVWQWNHNPDPALWSLTKRKGFLRLTSGRVVSGFEQAKNTLTQRTFGPVCSGFVCVDASGLKDGDFAGLGLLQSKYGQVGVWMENGKKWIKQVNVLSQASGNRETVFETDSVPLTQDRVYLKAECDFREMKDVARFFYSLDGENWTPAGTELKMQYTMPHFTGYRFALFNYSTQTSGGHADFDFFRISDTISDRNAEIQNNTSGLKDALKDKFLIGAALNTGQFSGNDPAAEAIIKKHFSAIVAENCMKSMYLQPREGEFYFEEADRLVKFGMENGIAVTGHCLVWHSQAPRWFFTDENGRDVSREVLIERMKKHITTVVSRYKGKIKGWDVVNEAIMEDGSYRKSKFHAIIGEDFIPLAFQFAHEADPDCELYYNDYNEWYPGKREAIVRLIKTMKERNIRIDAIGMQGHIGMGEPSIAEYEETIRAYTGAGVNVMVTELDLSILPSPKPGVGADIATGFEYRRELNPYTEAVPDSVSDAWNSRMTDFFRLFLKYSDRFSRVTVWGITDESSWKNDFPVRGRTDYPLLFDREYKAKPVVAKIIEEAHRYVFTQNQESKFTYNADGGIHTMHMTAGVVNSVGNLNPYQRNEAETIYVTDISNGDYIKVRSVDFGN
jgi:beta-xylosidase/GH35 family endo-1,4-beta-xylanase